MEIVNLLKSNLVKIVNRREHLTFHFVINGKVYFYASKGIKADYKIVLNCTKNKLCDKTASIVPSDFLKQFIQNSPESSEYPKILDNSDPRVYDINNYDINSFESSGAHTCLGTSIDVYNKNNFQSKNEIKIETANNSSDLIGSTSSNILFIPKRCNTPELRSGPKIPILSGMIFPAHVTELIEKTEPRIYRKILKKD